MFKFCILFKTSKIDQLFEYGKCKEMLLFHIGQIKARLEQVVVVVASFPDGQTREHSLLGEGSLYGWSTV